jgi:hypothetical protein
VAHQVGARRLQRQLATLDKTHENLSRKCMAMAMGGLGTKELSSMLNVDL